MESVARIDIVDASIVRATIAHRLIGLTTDRDDTLGQITLHPHQSSAAVRLRAAIDEFGGALLADPVGTGKTFTALSLANTGCSALVVAPAVLRDMWKRSAKHANRKIVFVSHEALSRGRLPSGEFDLAIVDEAHRARNRRTHRFAALARLVSGKKVVLMSATPIHNHRSDLATVLSLFLGERAHVMSPAELSRCIVRRENFSRSILSIPDTAPIAWLDVREDERIPAELLALPPPLPPSDGYAADALVIYSLIRQWASSDAALIGGVRRRLQRGEAMAAALSDGTWPSRRELTSWVAGDEAVQLAFAGILSAHRSDTQQHVAVISAHCEKLREILDLARASNADVERAKLIEQIRSTHDDARIAVFSAYADTARTMFERMQHLGHIAVLTGAGARVSGGAISRNEAIARFAPTASERRHATKANDITLLFTTDLLSEGVNLQDASVVIHMDLPWTPARLEQRIGRLARAGSPHAVVQSFAIRPPLASKRVIQIEAILRGKMREAGLVSQSFLAFDQFIGSDKTEQGESTQSVEAIRDLVGTWLADRAPVISACCACAVQSERNGFVGVIVDNRRTRLIGCIDNQIGEEPPLVLQCLRQCVGPAAGTTIAEYRRIEKRIVDWIAASDSLESVRPACESRTRVLRLASFRINRAARFARSHERARFAERCEQARAILAENLGAHREAQIESLCDAVANDMELVEHIIAMQTNSDRFSHHELKPRVLAIIAFHKR